MSKNTNNIAAIYVRVSTLKESQKDSPEHQKSVCLQKARMEGLETREEYIYEDRSTGTSIMEREEINQLIKDAKKGYFSTIIFASLSRFSRDSLDAIALKRVLVNGLGIRLISIDDTYDSKVKDDEMIFTIISAVNQKLSEQISLSSRRGIRESAMKGNFTGSHAPYGYKKVIINKDGKKIKTLEIVEKDAEVVRKIYELYVYHNMGEKQIINYLNEQGIPSPKGGIWGITTVQRILQNEAYTGRNVFSKYTVKKVYEDLTNMHHRKNRLVQTPKETWERSKEKKWDPIIPDELFQKAQEIRRKRGGGKRGGVRNVKVNPFAGIIKCAHCGSNFVSMKSGKVGKNGQEYRYLICSSRRRMGIKGCKNDLWIPLEDFKNELIKEITTYLSNNINTEEISAKAEIPRIDENNKLNEKKQKQLERTLAQNRKLLMELRREYKLGEIDEEQYQFEKEALEKEIHDIKEKLNQLVETKENILSEEIIKQQIKEALEKLVKLDFEDVDELQSVLKQLIEEIRVNKDGEIEIRTPLGDFQPS